MKRFHVHVATDDLVASIRFYSALFQAEPTVVKEDYAKWMLEDPRVNFAVSKRGHAAGVNHLGFQVGSDDELEEMHGRLQTADMDILAQTSAACCYAQSDKYWVQDPSGIAWETFHSLGTIPVFGDDRAASVANAACCVPGKSGCC